MASSSSNIDEGEFEHDIFQIGPPAIFDCHDIRLRVLFPFSKENNETHLFSKLTSFLVVYNCVDTDPSMQMRCWNTELQNRVASHGRTNAKGLQTLFLTLGITHENFVTKLREILQTHPYTLRYVPNWRD